GPELAGFDALSRGHHGAGRNPGAGLDDRPVHNAGFHADERAVFKTAGVDQGHVADGDALADPGVAVLDARDVHHRAVLHVGERTHMDRCEIAAEHAAEPDV